MPAPLKPWRVIVKATLIFMALNFLFISLRPTIMQSQVYNHLVGGRLRIPYAQPQGEQLVHSISVYEDMDAMFGAHFISSVREKPASEFRIVFLGDSSIWGAGLPPQSALPGQINTLHLMACDKKKVVAYNLAFPSLYVMKDLLILRRAMDYHPDLIVWGVTLNSLRNSNTNAGLFLPPYSDEALYLIRKYNLQIPTNSLKPQTVWDETLYSHRVILKKLAILQEDSLPWIATGLDYDLVDVTQVRSGNDINPRNGFMDHSTKLVPDDLMLDVLSAGDQLANPTPVLIIDEPIFIANGKNSDHYYDSYYSRMLYDQYRQILSGWANDTQQPYLDYWNAIPPSEFTNTPLHISAAGETQFASLLANAILRLFCSQ